MDSHLPTIKAPLTLNVKHDFGPQDYIIPVLGADDVAVTFPSTINCTVRVFKSDEATFLRIVPGQINPVYVFNVDTLEYDHPGDTEEFDIVIAASNSAGFAYQKLHIVHLGDGPQPVGFPNTDSGIHTLHFTDVAHPIVRCVRGEPMTEFEMRSIVEVLGNPGPPDGTQITAEHRDYGIEFYIVSGINTNTPAYCYVTDTNHNSDGLSVVGNNFDLSATPGTFSVPLLVKMDSIDPALAPDGGAYVVGQPVTIIPSISFPSGAISDIQYTLAAAPPGSELTIDSQGGFVTGHFTEAGIFNLTVAVKYTVDGASHQSQTWTSSVTVSEQSTRADDFPPGVIYEKVTGKIFGTPLKAGIYWVAFGVTSGGYTAQCYLGIHVAPAPGDTLITSKTSALAMLGREFTFQAETILYGARFRMVDGPIGFEMTGYGQITGTPLSTGIIPITFEVVDGFDPSIKETATLEITVLNVMTDSNGNVSVSDDATGSSSSSTGTSSEPSGTSDAAMANPLVYNKEGDDAFFTVRFKKASAPVTLDITDLTVALKEVEPDSILASSDYHAALTTAPFPGAVDVIIDVATREVTASTPPVVGTPYFLVHIKLDSAAIAGAESNYESDGGTKFLALGEFQWKVTSPVGDISGDIQGSSKTFGWLIERELQG
jgi:hypothetical protein